MTRRRSTARRAPARGGQQGYEPPVTRMRRDERILELALERWSQRQIAAEVGLTQGGVSKALRRIFTRQLATLTEETEASRQAGAAGGAPRAGSPGGARAQSGGRDHAPAAQGGGGWRGGGHDGRRARHAVRRGQSDLLGGGTAVRRVRREAARLVRPPRTPRGRAATGPRSGHRPRPPRRPPLVRPH